MQSKQVFITGISTEVGKTVVAAIVTEALEADYWKPVQAGELDYSDTDKVREWTSNRKSVFYKNSYALQTPMSPHAAAVIDNVTIELNHIKAPNTENTLVIEGAGGLFVPLNEKDTLLDLIDKEQTVLLVSRHYLGSINHTLLSVEALKNRGIKKIGILFNGEEHPSTESIIASMSGCFIIGRIPEAKEINANMVSTNAKALKEALVNFIG